MRSRRVLWLAALAVAVSLVAGCRTLTDEDDLPNLNGTKPPIASEPVLTE